MWGGLAAPLLLTGYLCHGVGGVVDHPAAAPTERSAEGDVAMQVLELLDESATVGLKGDEMCISSAHDEGAVPDCVDRGETVAVQVDLEMDGLYVILMGHNRL